MKVEIYSDVVCPWCYLGERRFASALADFAGADGVEVVFRPFQLDGDAPTTAVPLADYLTRRFGARSAAMQARVGEAARAEGIEIRWERALAANTREAHRLLGLAGREYGQEVQRALAERLFELHFTLGGDVSDPELLAGAAAAAGLDRERAARYLASDEGTRELEADLARARGLGIHSVPTFVIDERYAVEGAQPASTFLQVLQQVAELEASAAAGEGEACEDGTCAV